MELKRKLRPTMTKTNARHRGPTSSLDYTNMVNEALHDMILLGKVIDGEGNAVGQTDKIYNNFARYVNGGSGDVSSNIPTSSVMYKKEAPIEREGVLLQSLINWSTFGGCTVTQVNGKQKLTITGLAKPSGIKKDVDVEAGDIIFMRLCIKNTAGFPAGHEILIGSRSVNNGEQLFYKYPLPQQGSIGYVDLTIECLYKENISLDIFLLNDDSKLVGGSIDISECEICTMKKQEVNLLPVNLDVKSRINVLESETNNLDK